VFISYDLAVVEAIAHDVPVMNGGKIVESAPAERIFADPLHDYTRLLLVSVPRAAAT
jgi:peptide/nickel transport system ATP-binding protein